MGKLVHYNQKGFGIIEIVVTIGIIVVVVVSIGQALAAIYRLYRASELKTEAYIYAQQPIEIINGIKNSLFACSCAADDCSAIPGSCQSIIDGQICDLYGEFTTCWTSYPHNLSGYNSFKIEKVGSVWQLDDITPGSPAAVPDNSDFSREIVVQNVLRDVFGNINTSGTTEDTSTKEVTVSVYWEERGETRSISLSSILTAWENL